MVSAQQKAAFIEEHVSADLQYLWNDAGVDAALAYDLAQHYKSVRRFASMADDRADLKKALKDDFTQGQEPLRGQRLQLSFVPLNRRGTSWNRKSSFARSRRSWEHRGQLVLQIRQS